ncbi:Prokaryotic ubiquitin-like protein Pup [Corynebacterium oculi]|uniref:Prokaryotic ubiquitin-like protein Pup n=1 Tax=Corynebacterium oculi TaxID=1544416 RepID=A0A0Q1AG37_9CORY|nr:ubiquitin-like protein Pup [Corynebacterium oculi]KQB85597.1 Prokaryotic ubiquitin-like protein Pup [Corynebacterium oculi]
MSEHIHRQRHTGDQGEPSDAPLDAAQVQINTQGTDDLLDEIDDLLEDNAEEFVNSYVQKGGQ